MLPESNLVLKAALLDLIGFNYYSATIESNPILHQGYLRQNIAAKKAIGSAKRLLDSTMVSKPLGHELHVASEHIIESLS